MLFTRWSVPLCSPQQHEFASSAERFTVVHDQSVIALLVGRLRGRWRNHLLTRQLQRSLAPSLAACVVGVVTLLVRGGAQVLHGDQVVELSVLLEVHEREEEGEDGEGQIEVESERGELKERRTWMTMRMI